MTSSEMEEKFSILFDQLDRIEKLLKARPAASATGKTTVEPADEAELDGQYGDPVVQKKDPPRWKGASFIGCKFSECPPDYLDQMAGFLTWKANKNDEDKRKAEASGDTDAADKAGKYAWYARKDASRAAGWAKRLRDGWKAPESSGDLFSGDADGSDVPF